MLEVLVQLIFSGTPLDLELSPYVGGIQRNNLVLGGRDESWSEYNRASSSASIGAEWDDDREARRALASLPWERDCLRPCWLILVGL